MKVGVGEVFPPPALLIKFSYVISLPLPFNAGAGEGKSRLSSLARLGRGRFFFFFFFFFYSSALHSCDPLPVTSATIALTG